MNPRVNVPRPSGSHRYQAPEMRMGRSQFDLTHSHKTTFEVGLLVPYFLQEVIPGDTMTCRLDALLRVFSPLDAPIMDDIMAEIDFFFVPNRLVWLNWEYFLGAHDAKGAQDTVYVVPKCPTGKTVQVSSAAHYMGLPIGLETTNVDVVNLPFRSYVLIYDEWYRDQNLIDSEGIVKDDTTGIGHATIDPFLTNSLYKSAKKHDYFTSALPYLQKGSAVTIPFGTNTAPIRAAGLVGTELTVRGPSGASEYRLETGSTHLVRESSPNDASELYADLSSVTVSINALREAEAIQRLLERDARGGTRHPELIRAHFGVDVPDYRTQRPEYLGGGKGFVNVSPIANTSDTANRDQGELAGVGSGSLRASWAKSFVEHGWVLGILRARGQVTYQQGVGREWTRGLASKYEFLWPELVNLGEQPVLNKELFCSNSAATDNAVFGYQERYADYRFKKSMVTGKLASDAAGSLDFWHVAEDFASLPGLNQTFIEDATPMSRVTTVDSEPDFIIDGRFDLRVARILPVRPTPSLAPPRF